MTQVFINSLKEGQLIYFNRGTYGSKTYKGRVVLVDDRRKIIVFQVNEGKSKPAIYEIPFSGETRYQILPRTN